MPHRDGHGGRRASPRNHGVPQIEGLFYIQRTSGFTVSFVSLQSNGAGVWSDLSRPLDYVNHCHHHHHHYKKTLPKVEEIAECTHCSTAMKKLNQSQSRVVRSSFRLREGIWLTQSQVPWQPKTKTQLLDLRVFLEESRYLRTMFYDFLSQIPRKYHLTLHSLNCQASALSVQGVIQDSKRLCFIE